MVVGYFSPWRDDEQRVCRTCAHAIGTADGWHLWCERHRIVVVFPCALWEREPGADKPMKEEEQRNSRESLRELVAQVESKS
jgi:hypothetical protein